MVRKMFTLALAAVGLGMLGLTAVARAGDCCDDCGSCRKQKCDQCCSVTETKNVSKRVYDSECKPLCMPHCTLKCVAHSLTSGWKTPSDCDGPPCCDDCNACGCKKVCKQKFLIIKIKHHEECVHKCIATEPCCPATCEFAPAMPAPKGEPIPAPKIEGKGAVGFETETVVPVLPQQ
jgi:hypothetical protein